MWIIRLALNRPYTFVVAALLLLLVTPFILIRTPTDVLPEINIPVVSIIWNFTGLSAKDIEQRMVYTEERVLTTTVNDIQHIESTSYDGIGIIKVFFQPRVTISTAVAQITAVSQTILRQLPPGTTPPLIIQYSASDVPVLQYGVGGEGISEQQAADIALNQLRVGLITVPGIAIPYPYGGKQRLVSIDLDLRKLQEKSLTQSDVTSAVNAQALVFPSGTVKLGPKQYQIDVNTFPLKIDSLNELPIKTIDGATIRVKDVAQVRDGYDPQTNIVRQNGVRSVLMVLLKNGNASTLSVVSGAKQAMANVLKTVNSAVRVTEFSDQSVFVRAAISGVVREGVIAGALTALMILLFLGSWRSTIVVAISIPLSVLASLAVLSALGETINLMTLGGLALAVGILVDDATVTIENIERHMGLGEKLEDAILKGAGEIALPALVSTFCICIVFIPMFFLSGVARYLFVPFAEAVVFAVIASYLLSRTLVPTLVMWFERHNHSPTAAKASGASGESDKDGHVTFWVRPFVAFQHAFERGFDRFRSAYRGLLGTILNRRGVFAVAFLTFCVGSWVLVPFLGQDFFPSVDAGTFRLHVRAATGTRVEETANLVDQVEASIRHQIPSNELQGIVDNIGLPVSGINLSYSDSGVSGPADADITVALQKNHKATAVYIRQLRLSLHQQFPGATFYFLPADITTQTINFGLPAPLDIQVTGRDLAADQKVAADLAEKIRHVRGAVDVRIQQPDDLQRLQFAVDRTKASGIGLTEQQVASSVLLSLSGSGQVQPSYWLDVNTGVQYLVNIRAPEYRLESLAALQSVPISAPTPGMANGQILSNLASVSRITSQPIYTHYNIIPVVDVYAGVASRDLGGVLSDIKPIIAQAEKNLPRGVSIIVRGQAQTMSTSFFGLAIGLVMSIALIYLLLVVNFQSWLDPFIILTALTGALAGVIWGLHITSTTLSVPAMMGAIMCMGVATANSVLVVTFARQRLAEGIDPVRAAWEAGSTRLRPVLMTALAMIIGMLPMSLGLGEGGEQNAPLGRGVIGGLMIATVATLLFVPVVFSFLHRSSPRPLISKPEETNSSQGLATPASST